MHKIFQSGRYSFKERFFLCKCYFPELMTPSGWREFCKSNVWHLISYFLAALKYAPLKLSKRFFARFLINRSTYEFLANNLSSNNFYEVFNFFLMDFLMRPCNVQRQRGSCKKYLVFLLSPYTYASQPLYVNTFNSKTSSN